MELRTPTIGEFLKIPEGVPMSASFVDPSSARSHNINIQYKDISFQMWSYDVVDFMIEKDPEKYNKLLAPVELIGHIRYGKGFSGQIRKYFLNPCVLAYLKTPTSICYIYKTKLKMSAVNVFFRKWEVVLETIPLKDAYETISKHAEMSHLEVPSDVEDMILASQL